MNPHYSVHTFELTYRLNSEQFHCAKTMIKENGGYPEKAFWAIGQDKWYLSARSCKDAVLQAALAGIRIILTKTLRKIGRMESEISFASGFRLGCNLMMEVMKK